MKGALDVFAELAAVDARKVSAGGALLTEFRAFAESSPQCWQRDHCPDHFTASALVANHDGSRVLLGLHAKVDRWLQFGGHVEMSDATLIDTARREAEEESGLRELTLVSTHPAALDAHPAPCGDRAQRHLDVQFVFTASEQTRLLKSEESLAVSWFDSGDLPADTDASVRRLVDAGTRLLQRR